MTPPLFLDIVIGRKMDSKIQLVALKEFLKTATNNNLNTAELKTITVISYFLIIGGIASETNLLTLLKYIGLDFSDVDIQKIIYEQVAFYCGAGLLKIIDNHLGIKAILEDSTRPEYQQAAHLDTAHIKTQIDLMRLEFKKLLDKIYSEEI